MDVEANLQDFATLGLVDAESTFSDAKPQDGASNQAASLEGVQNDNESTTKTPEQPFDPRQCLFCKSYSVDFDENLDHMNKKHSFFIPHDSKLIVDPETFIKYVHLVVFGYHECLYCGSPRQTVEAAQQHMVGKGHCKIDIDMDDSEYQDFYQMDFSEKAKQARRLMATKQPRKEQSFGLVVEKPFGRRTQRGAKTGRSKIPQAPNKPQKSAMRDSNVDSKTASDNSSGSNSKRVAKMETAFQKQLASLRVADRANLMHLPAREQKALVMESKKQAEKAKRQENEMRFKAQLKDNKGRKC
ncbi:hypothetical protein HIM_09681 [Hirsutella minnesotensis 3608]|uniref:ZN622/Rei1/Reh1 zinc finger C2H2-type domain-containing protein n=1 Tax=Hirsutella minnesotensis 3608 TaxID=1043627 RepID=A0A0F7ZL46_9HYPO|nr:hypothetical protein HIM_09681 [Hirsutella minnesotensis 3608]